MQEEWSLKHKDKASAASMERVQHFGEAFAKIQEATGVLHCTPACLPACLRACLPVDAALCLLSAPVDAALCLLSVPGDAGLCLLSVPVDAALCLLSVPLAAAFVSFRCLLMLPLSPIGAC